MRGMLRDNYRGIALGVESAWPSAEMELVVRSTSRRAAVSSIVRNVILIASCVAFFAAALRGIAALPEALHGAGVVLPHAWEQAILESLQETIPGAAQEPASRFFDRTVLDALEREGFFDRLEQQYPPPAGAY